LLANANAEMLEIVTKDFAGTFPPVGQHADAGFQVEVEGIDDHAVGSGTADTEKIFFLFGIFERSRQAEGDFFHGAANEFFGGTGDVPGDVQFLGENVGGATREKSEGDTVAIPVGGKTVNDFIEGTVAAAGDDQAAAFIGGAGGDFCGVAGAGGFGEFGFDATSGKIWRAASSVRRRPLPPPPALGL